MNLKKQIRLRFRDSVFKRDNYCCRTCGFKSTIENCEKDLDSHHIIDRNYIPFNGYVMSNGISLCTDRIKKDNCHQKAEQFHVTGVPFLNFSPLDLYKIIESNYKKAYFDSIILLGLIHIDKNQILIIENTEYGDLIFR